MPLELVPTLDELNTEALEKRLEAARVQRLMMRIQYTQARNIKLAALGIKTRARLTHQVDMFGREIAQLDAVIEKCAKRLEQIQIIRNELTYIADAEEEGVE